MKISRALLSVSDKRGIDTLAHELVALGIELISTGGTAALLRQQGIAVRDVADLTGFPEMLDGRVKTLHPRVHGGILARRDLTEHMQTLKEHDIAPIDLVVVNLYPFQQTIARPECSLAEAIENIDIGGPAMVRAAAKNHGDLEGGVGIVTDPDDYSAVIDELRSNGMLSYPTRFRLAARAYAHTAAYDGAIANYLTTFDDNVAERCAFPASLHLSFDKVQDLRYGENPHQSAAFYREKQQLPGSLAAAALIQGKPLSYNNLADADAAWECAKTLAADTPDSACVIVKHANPCGVALASTTEEAYKKAFATDPTSAFGGIIALTREVDGATAHAISAQFLEVLIAPAYSAEALVILQQKQNVRVLQCALDVTENTSYDYKRIGGGLLVQTADTRLFNQHELQVVSRRKPTPQEMNDLLFAWKVAKYVKSNAIVYCRDSMTIGVGAGQMSRVDSARIAAIKAENAGLQIAGSVVASDAFFPFRDGLDVLAQAGATAVIQPGGSVRDAEVIAAADEQNIAMVLTGCRHFRH